MVLGFHIVTCVAWFVSRLELGFASPMLESCSGCQSQHRRAGSAEWCESRRVNPRGFWRWRPIQWQVTTCNNSSSCSSSCSSSGSRCSNKMNFLSLSLSPILFSLFPSLCEPGSRRLKAATRVRQVLFCSCDVWLIHVFSCDLVVTAFYPILVFVDPEPFWLLKADQCFGISQDDGIRRKLVTARIAVQESGKPSLKINTDLLQQMTILCATVQNLGKHKQDDGFAAERNRRIQEDFATESLRRQDEYNRMER